MNFVSIQSNFGDVILSVEAGEVVEDKFWVSLIGADEVENGVAIEEIVNVSKRSDKLVFENSNGLEFIRENEHHYHIKCRGDVYSLTLPKNKILVEDDLIASSFNISNDEQLFLVGCESGDLKIGELSNGEIMNHVKEAHYSSILNCQFFPSNKVALTTGLDYQIKIWDVLDGSNPRAFSGHKKVITDIQMIDRGRNFLSSSEDGSIKLWDCPSGLNISTLRRENSIEDGINTITLLNNTQNNLESIDSYEFGTNNKILFSGHNSGVISLFDLFNKKQISNFASLHKEVNKLISLNDNSLISSYKNGSIAIWDIRNIKIPKFQMDLDCEISNISLIESKDLLVLFNGGFISRLDDFPNKMNCNKSIVGFENYSPLFISNEKSNYLLNENFIFKY